VKELKGFQKVDLLPGEAQEVCFTLHQNDLAFWTANHRLETEPGDFLLWITSDSRCKDQEGAAFRVA
jgi:beta-glucosidase